MEVYTRRDCAGWAVATVLYAAVVLGLALAGVPVWLWAGFGIAAGLAATAIGTRWKGGRR